MMRKYGLILAIVVLGGGAAAYYFAGDRSAAADSQQAAGAQQGTGRGRRGAGGGGGDFGGGGGFGGAGGARGGGFAGPRPPMTVELASATRTDMADTVTVVGNLIGAATVVETSLARNKSLLDRQLLPRQTYDDTEARHQAAVAQLDLAKAQAD